MNTTEIMIGLNHLRNKLHECRMFYNNQQKFISLLTEQFPYGNSYFNNGTFTIELPENISDRLREENGDLVIPFIYDKVNEAILDLFRVYSHDIRTSLEDIDNGKFLYEYIINGECPYLGSLYQARFINTVIIIEL